MDFRIKHIPVDTQDLHLAMVDLKPKLRWGTNDPQTDKETGENLWTLTVLVLDTQGLNDPALIKITLNEQKAIFDVLTNVSMTGRVFVTGLVAGTYGLDGQKPEFYFRADEIFYLKDEADI